MRKKIILFLLLFCSNFLLGVIVERDSIVSVLEYLELHDYGPQTLLVFDIDNTIAETYPTEHGGDQWFFAMVDYHMKQGYEYYDAVKAVIPLYAELQNKTQLTLIEPFIIELMRDLKKKGIKIIALTARPSLLLECVIQQLKEIGIIFDDFESIMIDGYQNDHYCMQKGIIASGLLGNKKGEVLFEILKHLNFIPETLIYIDDKKKHVANVISEAEKRNIKKIIGIRYSRLDEKVRSYSLK